ncbi:MAG: hypothetical protein BGO67_12970 [Alphaproteobacteria bacterium 41-28]|nr:MAG: hypothetical protein BGO67_12970 [Alphaproteobacteria bacterium 41-28]
MPVSQNLTPYIFPKIVIARAKARSNLIESFENVSRETISVRKEIASATLWPRNDGSIKICIKKLSCIIF